MTNEVIVIMTKDQATFLLGLLDWENSNHPLTDEEADIMETLERAIEQSTAQRPTLPDDNKNDGEPKKCLKCGNVLVRLLNNTWKCLECNHIEDAPPGKGNPPETKKWIIEFDAPYNTAWAIYNYIIEELQITHGVTLKERIE